MRRAATLLVSFALIAAGSPADAALKKYELFNTAFSNQPDEPPDGVHFPSAGPPIPGSVVLFDTDVPGSPRLRKLLDAGNITITVPVPSLQTSIFLSNNDRTGPGVTKYLYTGSDGDAGPIFTGTGNNAIGQTIRWGTTTGWSVTGNQWCHSIPAVICTFADRMDLATTDPPLESTFYDLGTWYFHGTGFTSQAFIQQYFSTDFGNNQFIFRGGVVRDGTVPALQLIGLGVLGLSLAGGGVFALRSGNKR